jgi:hypothetical protein
MTLRSNMLGSIILIIMFGGIFSSSVLNLWNTKNPKTPARIKQGKGAGSYDPADIRGSNQFWEVSKNFDIPLDILKTAFGLPDDIDATYFVNSDLENYYGDLEGDKEIGNGSVKLFVALYKGLPYELPEDDYLLTPAVEILKNNANLTQEQIDYLDSHTIDPADIQPSGKSITIVTEEIIRGVEGEKLIRGKTTFADLLGWGLSEEMIVSIIGNQIPNKNMTVRDYCDENGLSFSEIKTAFLAELGQ